jgi:hypothetical protein
MGRLRRSYRRGRKGVWIAMRGSGYSMWTPSGIRDKRTSSLNVSAIYFIAEATSPRSQVPCFSAGADRNHPAEHSLTHLLSCSRYPSVQVEHCSVVKGETDEKLGIEQVPQPTGQAADQLC